MPVAHLFPDAVEVLHIFQEGIVGGQIRTATEPLILRMKQVFTQRKVAKVGVDTGDVGRARMNDQRKARGEKRAGMHADGPGRPLREPPLNGRRVDPRFFEDGAVFQHAGQPTTPFAIIPGIPSKLRGAVNVFYGLADVMLQRSTKRCTRCAIGISVRGSLRNRSTRA